MSLATSFTPDFFSNCVLENTSGLNISKEALRGKQYLSIYLGIPSGSAVKKKKCLWCRRCGFDPWVGKIPWRRKQQPTPVFLSGKILWSQKPGGLCPWGHKESGRTEHGCISVYSTIHLSIHLPIYLSPIYLSTYPSIHLLLIQVLLYTYPSSHSLTFSHVSFYSLLWSNMLGVFLPPQSIHTITYPSPWPQSVVAYYRLCSENVTNQSLFTFTLTKYFPNWTEDRPSFPCIFPSQNISWNQGAMHKI